MKKALKGFFIAILLLNSGRLIGQETKFPATMDLLFNRIQVRCKGGELRIGLLAGIMDRGLVLRQGGQDKVIPYDDLKHVVIEGEKSRGGYISSGMILGLYLGNIVLFRAQDTPPFYMKHAGVLGIVSGNAFYAVVGGGIGYLISTLMEKGEREFDFTGEEKKKLKQWDRLQSFVTGIDRYRPKKIHLTVQGGYVPTWNTDRYRSLLEKSGYSTHNKDGRKVTKVSLLRKVQLTYSPISKAEFGLAMYFLGEPAISGYNYRKNPSTYADQSIDIKGYFAVAAYHPFPARKARRLDWNVGIGMGMADVDFDFYSSTYGDAQYGWNMVRVDDFHLSKRMFSAVVFTELKVGIQKGISLGLMADYVYIPKVGIPEFPGAGIAGQNLNLGNASFGFSLGFHF